MKPPGIKRPEPEHQQETENEGEFPSRVRICGSPNNHYVFFKIRTLKADPRPLIQGQNQSAEGYATRIALGLSNL